MSDTYKSDRAISRRAMLSSFIGAAFLARFPALRPTPPCGDMESMAVMLSTWTDLKGAQIGIGGEMFIGNIFSAKTNFPSRSEN